MKILLTGTSSSLGLELFKSLSKIYSVIGTYNRNKPKINTSKKKQLIKINLEKNFKIKNNFNVLIHCAAALPFYNFSNKKIFNINVNGFKKILKESNKKKCNKIILISTNSIYGNFTTKNLSEKTKLNPIDAYAKSKLEMERMLYKYYLKNEYVDILILRMPAILGKKSKHNFLSKALKLIKINQKIVISGANNYFNNIIHAKNISEIVKKSLKKNKGFNVYNIGSEKPMKFTKVISMIFDKLNIKKNILITRPEKKGFTIKLNKKLVNTYKIYSTAKTMRLFLKDNR
tara:strand:- start:2459 stop:3322 length:864 start_codon:yes stop_codon:yes gene_type:complete